MSDLESAGTILKRMMANGYRPGQYMFSKENERKYAQYKAERKRKSR